MAIVANSYQSKIWTFENKTDTTPTIENWGQHHGTWMGYRSENKRVVLGLKCKVNAPIKGAKLYLQTQGGSPDDWGCYDTYIHVSTNELPVSTLLTLAYDVDSTIIKSQYKFLDLKAGWGTDIDLQISSTFADDDLGGLPAGDIYVYLWSAYTAKLYVDYPEYNLVTRIIEVTDLPYTKPSAPSKISGSAPYTKPGDTITISWSEAGEGVSNAITGYKLVFSGAVSDTKYVSNTSSTSGSYPYPIPSTVARGSALKVTIYTQGTVSGFTESPASSTVTVTTINKLPTFTSAALENTIFFKPANSTTITTTVKFTGANTNDTGQTLIRYYYSYDKSNWTEIDTTTFSVKLQEEPSPNEKTMYFRISDGLEYSSIKSQTYYYHKALTVSISEASISSTYTISATASASGGNENYSYAWTYNGRSIGTSSDELSGIDVKNYGVNWGEEGTLKVTVTSNGGKDSAEATVKMPDAPTVVGFFNSSNFTPITAGGATDCFYKDFSFNFIEL